MQAPLPTFGIGGLAVLVASVFVLLYSIAIERMGGRRLVARMAARTALLAWMAGFAALAESGKLARFDAKPPPLAVALIGILVASIAVANSKVGDAFMRLPIGTLILFQSFRLPLEWFMHQAALVGIMPMEMSYGGYNFDILTGLSALILGLLARRGPLPRPLIWAWNIMGSLLLAVVLTVAVLATPMLHVFGEEPEHLNTFITKFPFVWLPSVLVAAAIFGHIVIFRVLLASSRAPSSRAPSSPSPDPGSA